MAKNNNKRGRHSEKKNEVLSARTKSISALSMALTSVCCIGPILLLALGLGSVTLTAVLIQNKWLFMSIGAASLSASYYLYFRERRRCITMECALTGIKARKAIMGIATGVVLFFVVFSLYPYSSGSSNSLRNPTIRTASTENLLTVLYFWEPCPTCTVTNPAVKKLEKRYKGQASFRWVNLIADDDAYPLGRKYEIRAIPWLVFTDGRGAVKSQLGGWFTFEKAERHLLGIIPNRMEAR